MMDLSAQGWIENHLASWSSTVLFYSSYCSCCFHHTFFCVHICLGWEKASWPTLHRHTHTSSLSITFSGSLFTAMVCSMFCSTMGSHCNSSHILVCVRVSICKCLYVWLECVCTFYGTYNIFHICKNCQNTEITKTIKISAVNVNVESSGVTWFIPMCKNALCLKLSRLSVCFSYPHLLWPGKAKIKSNCAN